MRFQRIRLRHFGALSDLDTGSDPLGPLVVVRAPNEGGKSTFFVLLSSLLYGFYPASRQRHPYAPWSGEEADVDARVLLGGGETVKVHRRLLASPWGRLNRGDREEDLANRTVPWASHVRRKLFEEVFALTLSDLARVDEDRWPEIQDRLLGSMGADDVRGSREVVEELEADAKRLWRPDRVGKPRAGELQERLEELNARRREAAQRDRDARAVARKLERARAELAEVRGARREARAVLERARTLGPVRRKLRRIRVAEERAGDPERLSGVPVEPEDRFSELRREEAELAERVEDREREAARLRERAESVTDAERAILERAPEIRELGRRGSAVGTARDREATLEERGESLERRVREAGRELFDRPWDDVDGEDVRRFPLGDLRARIAKSREAEAAAARLRERLKEREREAPDAAPGWGIPGPVLLLAGAGLAAAGWAYDLSPLFVGVGVGVVAAFVGAVLLVQRAGERKRWEAHRRALDAVRSERSSAEAAAGRARRAVAEAGGDLPLAGTHLENPRSEIVHVLERLQEALEDLRQTRSEASAIRERIEAVEDRADALADDLGLDAAPGELQGKLTALEGALEAAAEREADARSAREALDESERSLARLRDELERVADERAALEERLAALGDGDPRRGIEEARARLEARDRARVLRRELERDHPNFDDVRGRIREAEEAGEEWTVDEEAVVAAEEEVDELDRREKSLIEEIKDLEHDLQRLQEGTTLDRVEGEIRAVEEELDGVRRRRDRLALLARIVRKADHRFRERNQPDLLRAAGRHLSTITDGRYGRLLMPEGEMDGTLLLQGPGYPGPVEVDTPVSTGTREQVYLALRLAIVGHLDASGERLPLFLDEAFVNWDEDRRERGFELLAELAGERQIFVFTCHRDMARSLGARGARVLDLAGPE